MCAQVAHIEILVKLSVQLKSHCSFRKRPLALSVGLLKTCEILWRIKALLEIRDRTYGLSRRPQLVHVEALCA